jgi:hypothetical protein
VHADPSRVTPRQIMSAISALGHLAKVHREPSVNEGTP